MITGNFHFTNNCPTERAVIGMTAANKRAGNQITVWINETGTYSCSSCQY